MSNMDSDRLYYGRCDCGYLTYSMRGSPIVVHACHCRTCQRQTGTAFALHAVIEVERLKRLTGSTETVSTETGSGAGQIVTRCADCHFAVWSCYLALGEAAKALRSVDVGTLDEPDHWPPDYHIFTKDKQPWLRVDEGAPSFEEWYDVEKYWNTERLQRWKKALGAA